MNVKLPSLNLLKTFDTAARLKSFKDTAEQLYVTPTAVSHQMKALEAGLGIKLFVRRPRALELTEEGEILAAETSKIFQQITVAIDRITKPKNTLTISTTSSFAAMWLLPKLECFYAEHPGINVSVVTNEKLDDLNQESHIDFAIRYGEFEQTESTELLVTETIGLFATPRYLSTLDSLSDALVLETQWLNPELRQINWAQFSSGLAMDNKERPRIRKFNQEHQVIQAALSSQGLALVSSLLIENALSEGWLVSYEDRGLTNCINGFSYYLVHSARLQHNRIGEIFIDWLKAQLKRAQGAGDFDK